jgi:hypothetical protein
LHFLPFCFFHHDPVVVRVDSASGDRHIPATIDVQPVVVERHVIEDVPPKTPMARSATPAVTTFLATISVSRRVRNFHCSPHRGCKNGSPKQLAKESHTRFGAAQQTAGVTFAPTGVLPCPCMEANLVV